MLSLDFAPTERPPWRPAAAPSTSAMLAGIAAASARLAALPPHLAAPLRARFQRAEAVAFVQSSNWLELVGTQDDAETRALCERAAEASAAPASREARETVQTLLALECARRLQDEARAALAAEAGAPRPHLALQVSPDSQCEIHAVLMRGLVDTPGSYRRADARPQGFSFLYPPPEAISNRMLAWTDTVNDLVVALPAVSLASAFGLAALVLFHSVDVHAFEDGNGRLCRILASGMLSEHHFFPVHLQPLTAPADGSAPDDSSQRQAWRRVYIGAIEACRGDAARRPADLAALLIESSWAAWQRVAALVAATVDGDGAALLGSITLGGRVGRAARERVGARWESLCHDRRLGGRPEGAAAREEDIGRLCAAAGGRGAPARVRLQDGSVVHVFA